MIRVLVVADSGADMATITGTLADLMGVDIVAYANGTVPIAAVLRASRPDIVLVAEMRRPGRGASRVAEARAADSRVPVVGLAERADGTWAPAALRAGAAAVVPCDLEAATLGLVLREVLDPMAGRAPARSAA